MNTCRIMNCSYLFFIAIMAMISNPMFGQIAIPLPMSDFASKPIYNDMLKQHVEIAAEETVKTLVSSRLKKLHVDMNNDLTVIAPQLLALHPQIVDFVLKGGSTDFLNDKYKTPNNSRGHTGNTNNFKTNEAYLRFMKDRVIKWRLYQRLKYEAARIDEFFDQKIPISEGKRLYFTMSSIENALNIVLKDEEF